MKRITVLLTGFLLVFCLSLPAESHAQMDGQTTVRIGPRIGVPLGDMSDLDASIFLGADVRVDTESLPVVPNASFDYYINDVDNASYYAVDLNALYELPVDDASVVPYVGGGLGFTRVSFNVDTGFGDFSSSSTELGINILGGVRFPVGSVEPFAQLNATLGGDVNRIGLAGGILFTI